MHKKCLTGHLANIFYMLGFSLDEPLQAAGCSCAVDPPAAQPATEVSYDSLQLHSLTARGPDPLHCCELPQRQALCLGLPSLHTHALCLWRNFFFVFFFYKLEPAPLLL